MTKPIKTEAFKATLKSSATTFDNFEERWATLKAKTIAYGHAVNADPNGAFPTTYEDVSIEMELREERREVLMSRSITVSEQILATQTLAVEAEATRGSPTECQAYFHRSARELMASHRDQNDILYQGLQQASADAAAIKVRHNLQRSPKANRYDTAIPWALGGVVFESAIAMGIQVSAGYGLGTAFGLATTASIVNTGVFGAATGGLLAKYASAKNSPKWHPAFKAAALGSVVLAVITNMMLGHYRATGNWLQAWENFTSKPLFIPDIMGWAMTAIGLTWVALWMMVFFFAGDFIIDYGDAHNRETAAKSDLAENRAAARKGVQELGQQAINEIDDGQAQHLDSVVALNSSILASQAAAEACTADLEEITNCYGRMILRVRGTLKDQWGEMAPAFLSDRLEFEGSTTPLPSLEDAVAKHEQLVATIDDFNHTCDLARSQVNQEVSALLELIDTELGLR